jgi:hypothetical protein
MVQVMSLPKSLEEYWRKQIAYEREEYAFMTKAELQLVSVLLDLAADDFSNHGCNDFDLLKEGGLTQLEVDQVNNNLIKEEIEGELRNTTYDWLVMRLLAKKIRKIYNIKK